MVENPRIAVGISTVSMIVPEMLVFPVLVVILLFPVVGRCRNHLGTLSLMLLLSES